MMEKPRIQSRMTQPARAASFRLHLAVQVVFLGIFVVLLAIGKTQVWMLLFAVSALLAALLGRFYCGWFCPIQTVMSAADKAARRLGMRRRAEPGWMKHFAVRIALFVVFMAVLVLTVAGRRRLPVLPALLVSGTVLALIYSPVLWHRYLCPFGTVLSLTASPARRFLEVTHDRCANCSVCVTVCPGGAVATGDQVVIDKRYCLQCSECRIRCPKGAIHF